MQLSIWRRGAAGALCAAALLALVACGEQSVPDTPSEALTVETEAASDAPAVSPAPAAPTAADGAQEAWYAIIPFEVAPENRDRVFELTATGVAPAQAAIGREMLQFFPTGEDTGGFLILGRFDSEEDARAHANPGQDQEFLAAYQAHMGAAGAAATQETMTMMTPGPAMIARRTVSDAPVVDGAEADAEPVYYLARKLDFSDEGADRARHIISEYFTPASQAVGREVMEFQLAGEEPWDSLAFFGRYDSAEAAADRTVKASDQAYVDAIARVVGDAEEAAGLRAEMDAILQNEEVTILYRHPVE